MRALEGFDGGQLLDEMSQWIDAIQQARARKWLDDEGNRRRVADGQRAPF
jgi:hypothetical protein